MAEPWVSEVLDFWFGLAPEQWWKADVELDRSCRARFKELWQEQRGRLVSDFLGSPNEALAAIILFDQLPRNMFRGVADQFATDHLALGIAKDAVDRGYDEAFEQPKRGFMYMPFQHSEKLEDQQRSLALFTALGDDNQLEFAKKHHDVIERFGRVPHRNPTLGREPRPAEIEAGEVVPW
jgi:uncharacterized protein (DUF924 family)